MTRIENTIVLTEEDLNKGEPPNSSFSFSKVISREEVNKAHNIIFIDKENVVKFLKIKDQRKFREYNGLI